MSLIFNKTLRRVIHFNSDDRPESNFSIKIVTYPLRQKTKNRSPLAKLLSSSRRLILKESANESSMILFYQG